MQEKHKFLFLCETQGDQILLCKKRVSSLGEGRPRHLLPEAFLCAKFYAGCLSYIYMYMNIHIHFTYIKKIIKQSDIHTHTHYIYIPHTSEERWA